MTRHVNFAWQADYLEGKRDGRPPLVLLHGLTFDRQTWQSVLGELYRADPDRQVLAMDLPGHGGSALWPGYDIASVTAAVHQAVEWARLAPPVVVGHSLGAIIATRYAASFPARGVVNVDQWLRLAPAVTLVKSLKSELTGEGFHAAWHLFEESMHIELLPRAARRLLREETCVRQDVVTGYWREAFHEAAEVLEADIESALERIRANGLGYHFIAGHQVEPEYRDWLTRRLPNVVVEVWPDSGHFPHLANPAAFARLLTRTADWTTARPALARLTMAAQDGAP